MENRVQKILLVDDDADHRALTSLQLTTQGVDVEQAASGEDALAAVDETRFDLILLDFNMGGIDGIETLQELRKRFSENELPVLMLSAYQNPDTISRALDSGANDYISKDVHPKVLQSRVRRHLHDVSLSKVGQPTLGDFQIQKRLSRTTLSTTFLLEHPEQDDLVVARLLKPGFSLDEEALKALNRVNHCGVSNVLSWDSEPVVYVLTEFSQGKPLADHIHGGFGIFPTLALITKLMETLKAIHDAGMTHGDIHPGSVLVKEDGQPVLLDLGVMRAIVQDNEVTPSDFCLGDPAYQSPERIAGSEDLDIRSDLYSLGAIFFHLLTGKPPFEGTPSSIAASVTQKEAPLVSEHRSDGLRRFDGLVSKLLNEDPDHRYQNLEQLTLALKEFEIRQ